MLIIIGGLPGVGKTTLSKTLATELKAIYLRIDTVEQILKKEANLMGSEGYEVCFFLAEENQKLGMSVIADAVNPVQIARDAWVCAAKNASVPWVEIEVICSDTTKHKKRIESRTSDIKNHILPTWEDVVSREYESWDHKDLQIDTSSQTIEVCCNIILNYLSNTLTFW